MNPVIYMNCDLNNIYKKNTFFSRIKDKFTLTFKGESKITELGLTIAKVRLPSNFNSIAYRRNIETAKKVIKSRKAIISPKTLRVFDYEILNGFQKSLIAYSVIKSIQLILRNQNKSIKNSCIVVYDSIDKINLNIIYELCKSAKFVILLSKDVKHLSKISDYVVANYGVSPVITNDFQYALKVADFIISNKEIDNSFNTPIWYLDNRYNVQGNNSIIVNDIDYRVPWNNKDFNNMSPELLGAILGQMEEKDIERSLKYNGIYVNSIRFNDNILEL